jgi:hypothetical protein
VVKVVLQQHIVNRLWTSYVNILKIIKSFKIYNLFMDDQYCWIVCLPFICFTCCLVWRVMSTGFLSRERVLPVLAERGGLCHRFYCSSINNFWWRNAWMKIASQQSMCDPFRHVLSSCNVFSFVPYSCLFSKICVTYPDAKLFDLVYLMCSLNLTPIPLPDCPT